MRQAVPVGRVPGSRLDELVERRRCRPRPQRTHEVVVGTAVVQGAGRTRSHVASGGTYLPPVSAAEFPNRGPRGASIVPNSGTDNRFRPSGGTREDPDRRRRGGHPREPGSRAPVRAPPGDSWRRTARRVWRPSSRRPLTSTWTFLDIKMPGRDGLEILARTITERRPDTLAVVMISGHGTIDTAVEATRRGAFDFIEKPLDRERVLLDRPQRPPSSASSASENTEAPRSAHGRRERTRMVGSQPGPRRRCARSVEKVAPTQRAGAHPWARTAPARSSSPACSTT